MGHATVSEFTKGTLQARIFHPKPALGGRRPEPGHVMTRDVDGQDFATQGHRQLGGRVDCGGRFRVLGHGDQDPIEEASTSWRAGRLTPSAQATVVSGHSKVHGIDDGQPGHGFGLMGFDARALHR